MRRHTNRAVLPHPSSAQHPPEDRRADRQLSDTAEGRFHMIGDGNGMEGEGSAGEETRRRRGRAERGED